MPVTGLPSTLESIINAILTDAKLTSYKIAGFRDQTTVVLRFAAMADTVDVPTVHQPASAVTFRRKSSVQMERDRTRKQNYISSLSAKTTTNCFKQVTSTKNDGIAGDIQLPPSVKQPGETSVLHDNIQNSIERKAIVPVPPHSKSYYYTADPTSEDQSFTDGETEMCCDDNTTSTSTQNQLCIVTQQLNRGRATDSANSEHSFPTQSSTHNSQSKISDRYRVYETYLHCENIRQKRLDLKTDTIKFITHKDRNNSVTKLLRDARREALLAETDDLILEYCLSTERITQFVVKSEPADTNYDDMRLRHMRDWTNIMSHLQVECRDHVENIMKALPLFKEYLK